MAEAARQSKEPEGYLSDDAESRMRELAPSQCRLCTHLIAQNSVLTASKIIQCGKPEGEDENANILGVLLMRLAKYDQCEFMLPFNHLLPTAGEF